MHGFQHRERAYKLRYEVIMPSRETISERIRHKANPLHVYCRLVDYGMNNNYALKLSFVYEELIYNPLDEVVLKPLYKIETSLLE